MKRIGCIAAGLVVARTARADDEHARTDRLEDFDVVCRFVAVDHAGFDLKLGSNAMRGALVVGLPMAGLLGALGEPRPAHAGFVVRIPAERPFPVDGTPREAFVPCRIGAADAGTESRHVVELASRRDPRTTARCPR